MLAVTKLHSTYPVRRLRYYPAFHHASKDVPYPAASANSGLFAVLGWSGTVVRLPADELSSLLSSPPGASPVVDAYGAGFYVWNLTMQDAVLDAVVCGSAPSFICDPDEAPPSAPLRLVVGGINPPVATYSVTADPAFSARATAARVASSFMSAARGFLFSRIATASEDTNEEPDDQREAVTGVARNVASWSDDPTSQPSFLKFSDVRGTARKAFTTGFNTALQGRLNTVGNYDRLATRSGSAPYGKLVSSSHASTNKASAVAGARTLQFSKIKSSLGMDRRFPDSDSVQRQNSISSSDGVTDLLTRSARNARVVERVFAAPHPCSLFATCDTLGRIFVQDPRDFCVLRVLKGYRDANAGWLAEGGPFLVVHAPRLNVVEIHGPLEQKRREAFRVLPGTLLVQTTCFRVFCVFPDGRLFEVKTNEVSTEDVRGGIDVSAGFRVNHVADLDANGTSVRTASDENSADIEGYAPEYELIGAFVEAVKSGKANQALECLQRVEDDSFKVAHLMATLIACTAFTPADVHAALASKAGQIAAKLQNPDLVCRFEAHGRLAEAFQLVEADAMPQDLSADRLRMSKYGPRLLDDELGNGLVEFGMNELTTNSPSAEIPGRSRKAGNSGISRVNCERFILSHYLVPTVDPQVDNEYEIHPRFDLSDGEQKWLAMVYFAKLLQPNSANVSTAGREHPTTGEIFMALNHYIALSEAEITKQFVAFFLQSPLIPLLNTHVSIYASPLQCAVARIRSQFAQDVVDPIILDACETTTRIANAVLLVRLCAIHDVEALTDENTNPYVESLDRLNEVLVYRSLTAGSRVPQNVYECFTARRFSGTRGDAERHAVTCLIEVDDYDRVLRIFDGSYGSRKLENLGWHGAASVSEAALLACRKKAALLIEDTGEKVIPRNVVAWIRSIDSSDLDTVVPIEKEERIGRLRMIRAIMISAHAFIPDSSVDAVRSLQLAEAMSALLDLEPRDGSSYSNTDSDEVEVVRLSSKTEGRQEGGVVDLTGNETNERLEDAVGDGHDSITVDT